MNLKSNWLWLISWFALIIVGFLLLMPDTTEESHVSASLNHAASTSQPQTKGDSPTPSHNATINPTDQPPKPRTTKQKVATPQTTDPFTAALQLRADLLTADGMPARTTRAMVGLADIDPADQAAFDAALFDGGQAPEQLTDLAHVTTWLDARLNNGRLGPVPVPQAVLYRIVAWEQDGSYYLADITPDLETLDQGMIEAGVIRATPPTGLRLELMDQPQDLPPLLLKLSRAPDPNWREEDSLMGSILPFIDPEIARAFKGKPLAFDPRGMRLAPLYPDPSLNLTLTTHGGLVLWSASVDLAREQTKTITLELSRQLSGLNENTYDLEGRLVMADGMPLPEGARFRLLAPKKNTVALDAAGTFFISELPRDQMARFRFELREKGHDPESVTALPHCPGTQNFVFDPNTLKTGTRTGQVRWQVPTYRWLLLTMESNTFGSETSKPQPPFPVYTLQRSNDQDWQNIAADAFIPQEDGIAISITEPGTYRVIVSLSPLHEITTTPLRVGPLDRQVFIPVSLDMAADETSLILHLISESTGRPLAETLVLVIGRNSEVPPLRLHTDQQGRLDLGPVNVPRLHLFVAGREYPLEPALLDGSPIAIADPRLSRLVPNDN